ncbi:hypothetical protein ACJIZ3_013861 [Penstemon smallii]|uniref:Bifunctional inhibitor/plant lipid transfer protein/seed storage helical domain-containing protein n=1 Tax=Penstemon smallii TaxID=265156 RepID=A0ABD3RI83_9LAMI
MTFRFLILTLAISSVAVIFPALAQIITTPCTPAMITTFTPCMNFLTNSTSGLNGTNPSSDCCNSLNSLMSNGRDCFCLIATGSVPFRIPINRTLAISLPRACNMPGVPLQCKGPGANGPALSPKAAPPPSVQGLSPPGPLTPTLAPEADANPTTPTNNGGSTTPTTGSTTGNRAGVTPSSAATVPSFSFSPLLLVAHKIKRDVYFFEFISFVIALTIIVVPVNGQSSSLCTGPMMRIVTPCISFLASGSNVSRPSSDCCSSIKDLMSNGQDCLCLIVTGGAPFEVPINRTLAISLPRSCRMSGVPIECKATASPIPSPDSRNQGQNGPNNMFPGLFPPPTGPFINPQPSPPSFTPGGGRTTPFVPGDVVPTLTPPGMRPTLISSATQPFHNALSSLIVAVLGVILLKFY